MAFQDCDNGNLVFADGVDDSVAFEKDFPKLIPFEFRHDPT